MSEGNTTRINQRFLPFAVLSEHRTDPFTPDVEAAAVFSLAELDRAKGSGLIMKQPEEKITYIAKLSYPLWLFPWSELSLIFDGLNQNSSSLTYVTVPDVTAFLDNLRRGARTQETHMAFLSDNINYFQTPAAEKMFLMNGLIQEPQFQAEFDGYRREASKTSQENLMALLPPSLDEAVISSGIHELENLHSALNSRVENLYKCIKLLSKVTRQYVKELRNRVKNAEEDFDSKIKEEELAVAPRINQIKDEYDFQTTSLAKNFEKKRLPIEKEKKRLEKSREQAVSKLERGKLEAKTHAEKNQRAAEERWKEKNNKTKKELSEIENQLKQTEKNLKDLEEKRTIEIFKLHEEQETKVKEARQCLLELEASRDAKILIHTQEVETLEKQTREISDQINRTAKLLEANIAQFEKLGIKKEFGSYGSLMYYMPFYVVCYQRESNKRYIIIPPSVVSTVGIFTKLKGALGMSKIKRLLTPRFKTVASFLDSINVLALQDGIFETELNELGAKNNLLADAEVRKEIKVGLSCLKSEGWLSDKEFELIDQRIS
jgi:chemotaxis protein histidine kinase CheA